jgi:hypothetical protein
LSEEDTVYGDGAGRHFWEGATHVSAVDSVRKRWSTQGHGEADSSCFNCLAASRDTTSTVVGAHASAASASYDARAAASAHAASSIHLLRR